MAICRSNIHGGSIGAEIDRKRFVRLAWSVALVMLLVTAGSVPAWAVQRHTLEGEQAAAHEEPSHGTESQHPAADSHGTTHEEVVVVHEGAESEHGTEYGPAPGAHGEETLHGEEAAHGEHGGGHGGGHGVELPAISPIPGVTFVETMIDLMDYELHGRLFGWRPNDIVLSLVTDNIENYQLGVLEAVRFTCFQLKTNLTRMGEADTYDRDLEDALNLLMNRAREFWFPSAESSYSSAVDHLRAFLEKLKTGERSFYYRVDNLQALVKSYEDILGNVNKNLIKQDASWWLTDNYFYYAKGVAHVVYEILRVVRAGYTTQLETLDGFEFLDEVLHELHRAEILNPWFIVDGSYSGFIANHRANLNAPLSEVCHVLGIMSRL